MINPVEVDVTIIAQTNLTVTVAQRGGLEVTLNKIDCDILFERPNGDCMLRLPESLALQKGLL